MKRRMNRQIGAMRMNGDDDLLFLDDQDPGQERPCAYQAPRWKMLIVDDEPEVHSITKLVLADFEYKGRPAHFISAYSAAEARAILAREDDIAIILLDVVMETDDAGLKLVHHIREELRNRHVRIILRTGQPGQAPERAVILDYDINDYKAKTQLTAQQLFTTTVAALRSYEDITALETNRRGLEKIIEASSSLFKARSMKLFAAGVLTQLSAILGVGPDAILCVQRGSVIGGTRDGLYVLAGSGRFESLINEPALDHIDEPVMVSVVRCLETRSNIYEPDHCTLYIRTPNDRENVVYLRSDRPLSDLDRRLIEVFCGKISVGFDNLYAFEQLRRAQEGTLLLLAEMAERHDPPPGGAPVPPAGRSEPTLRIAAVAETITRHMAEGGVYTGVLDTNMVETIGLAAIMHDVGNAAVDPAILGKAGCFTDEERQAMRAHVNHGWRLLERASMLTESRTYLHLAVDIARHHHENWDGTGYPEGLAGADIPLSARIVAVADAYDAMTSPRPHRPALAHDEAVAQLRAQAGIRFDPAVVDAFLMVEETVRQL